MAIKEHTQHALDVLEYDRIREVLSSYAASALGRQLAVKMEPLRDARRLRTLHAETMELCELQREKRLSLSGLSDVASGIRAVRDQGRPAEPGFLYAVVELIRAGQSLKSTLGKDPELFPHLARLASGIDDIPDLREEIPASIDPGGKVRDEASEKLAATRKEIQKLRKSLREQTTAILKRPRLRKCFQAEGVKLKDDRYLLPVKAEYRSWIHGPIRDRSQTGATLYVESDETVQQGDQLIDKLEDERGEVSRVLWELTRTVLDRRDDLKRLQSRLAKIDFTYAKASYAAAFDLEAPEIDEQGELALRNARHPYLLWLARDSRQGLRDLDLEAIRDKVVPLDIRMGASTRLLIITGPNTGGKTVALKTVGLNVLLGLSGVPIAADAGSRMPIFHDAFADIGDEQSIEQSLSTFSSHLTQVAKVLRHASKHSLILLDELGSGTDPIEGAALGNALLDAFRERGWTAIITTHLGSLKQYAYLHDGVENAAMEFNQRTLKPTYRLLMGIPGSSNALAIAKSLGIDADVIDKAQKEIHKVEAPTREIISRMEHSRRRTEKERRRAEKTRRRVQKEARAYEERIEEVKARQEALDLEAELEVDRVVRSAQDDLGSLVKKLKNVPQIHRPLVDELEERLEKLLVATPLGEKREAFARSLRKGDEVFVPKFRCKGTVKKINKGERILVVLISGIPTELSFDDISWVDGPATLPDI